MTTKTIVPFPVDLVIFHRRNSALPVLFADRLRGTSIYLDSSAATAEPTTVAIASNFNSNTVDGIDVDGSTGGTWVSWNFKRAPGFFDVVCYRGSGVSGVPATVNHNLGVAPELIITFGRSFATAGIIQGQVWTKNLTGSKTLYMFSSAGLPYWGAQNASNITATSFRAGFFADPDDITDTFVAYLFATLAGISKVGSYTGNGSSQNIECGFAAGARFVLIKRTDSTGDWFVWDTARGIVAANDPHLSLNTTAAEVTTDDSIDPYSAGFTVNQVAATNINVSSATYIYLAIA